MGRYFPPWDMAVIRLVPSTEESHHIAYQFGEQDDAEEDRQIIEAVDNGLVMYQPFADRFLNGELMIIPLKSGEPLKLRVILLNEIIGMCTIPGFRYRYGDLNYKTLDFQDDCQPNLRCLHWRYIINLERSTNRSWLNVERTPKWGVRGPFMRKGIIRHMDLSWGRRGIPNEIAFADTIWNGVEARDAEFDRGIAGTLERSTRENRSGSENSRSRSGQSQYTSGANTVSATNQGVPASSTASGAMPGAIGPIGTMPGAA
ncbi:hypothetical protein JMJ35_005368 [Cladonia borealis]|uniref:Uncharacterized protein n=1 Tax=Cladonia borealis TaxID=184061 RepID=A0AA39R1V9_9LECA|nr:hypothetical protein JMJ35_005368 [Cladonia borealis]